MGKRKDTLVSGKMQSRCFLWSSFSDPALEKLYQSYSVKQKRAGLECFLITAVLFDIYMLVVPSGQDLMIFGVMSLFLALNCCLLIWCKRGVHKSIVWAAVPHISWHTANAQVCEVDTTKCKQIRISQGRWSKSYNEKKTIFEFWNGIWISSHALCNTVLCAKL